MDLITLKAAVNQAKKEISGATPEMVNAAVGKYLEENPIAIATKDVYGTVKLDGLGTGDESQGVVATVGAVSALKKDVDDLYGRTDNIGNRFDGKYQNVLYSVSDGKPWPNNRYVSNANPIPVKGGDKIELTESPNDKSGFALFYAGEKYLGYQTLQNNSFIIANDGADKFYFEFGYAEDLDASTMPIVFIYINRGMQNHEPITQLVKSSYGVEYALNDGIASLTAKYDADNDILITLGKRGVNNLPDFRTISVGAITLCDNQTDFAGPFVVRAVNNADGDDVTNHTFTGGNHGYDNSGTMGNNTATARNVSLKFFADNVPVSDGNKGYCNQFEMVWTNRVQGYNTRKANGTGREIIGETHTLCFDGKRFEHFVEIMPLEDVVCETYYGFQASIKKTLFDNIKMYGAANRIVSTQSLSPESGNNIANAIKAFGDEHSITMEIDRSFDLGTGVLYAGNKGLFVSNSKMYSYLISNADMGANCVYAARGWYTYKHE